MRETVAKDNFLTLTRGFETQDKATRVLLLASFDTAQVPQPTNENSEHKHSLVSCLMSLLKQRFSGFSRFRKNKSFPTTQQPNKAEKLQTQDRKGNGSTNSVFRRHVQGEQHSDANLESFARKLCATANGAVTVDICDAYTSTPSLATLSAYDCVVLTGTQPLADPALVGDQLDLFLDSGGGVVSFPCDV